MKLAIADWLEKHHWWVFAALWCAFLVVRLLNFPIALNFSTDQATFSTRALEIWRDREITLVGPTASFNTQGRYLIQSSLIYYTTLLFQLPAGFDPMVASGLFVCAAALLSVFLYVGVRQLAGTPAALLVYGMYALAPVYLRHTQFLWNPNYQLTLTPVLIFATAQYLTGKRPRWLLASGFVTGFLTLFHYQFVVLWILAALGTGWLLLVRRRTMTVPREWYLWWLGAVLGVSPLLAFELRSQFYLTQTAWLLLKAGLETQSASLAGGASSDAASALVVPRTLPMHYITSLSLILFTTLVVWAGKLRVRALDPSRVALTLTVMLVWSVINVLPPAGQTNDQAYGMAPHWNYQLEKQAYERIAEVVRTRQLHNYAVANTLYDMLAPVTYFQLQRDNVTGWTKEYRSNDYLFVISAADGSSLRDNPAYEINTFVPVAHMEQWPLSQQYAVFLLERDTKSAEK